MTSQKHIICITGPESSGKSTLASSFSKTLNYSLVSEYSRTYLKNIDRDYVQSDLVNIAQKQLSLMIHSSAKPCVSDTGVEVVKIWNDYKFAESASINDLLNAQNNLVSHYLLCKPDIPWEPDPLRENPNNRMELFQLYIELLDRLSTPFSIIEGTPKQRLEMALSITKSSL